MNPFHQKIVLGVVVLSMIGFCSCVSKSRLQSERRTAFIAGQNAGMVKALQSRAANVTVVGDVKNPVVIWTSGLSVAQAFLQAEFRGFNDPRGFIIRRNGQQFRIEAKQLLNGEDFELEPGDILEIQQ